MTRSLDDPDVCIKALQRAADRVDGRLTAPAYQALGWTPSLSTVIEAFGSWSAALEAAGLEAESGGGPYDRAELAAAIRAVAARDDRDGPLTRTRYDYLRDDDMPAGQTIHRRTDGFADFRDRVLSSPGDDE